MSERKSFILYDSYYEQLSMLSMEERGQLLTAIYEYETSGRVSVDMTPVVSMAFSFIRSTLDRDRAEYEKRCERNRENGKKGGRPPRSVKGKTDVEGKKEADKKEDKIGSSFSEEDKTALINDGIPREYVEKRISKAQSLAVKKGMSAARILRLWWKRDKKEALPQIRRISDVEAEEWYIAKLKKQLGEPGVVSCG